MLKSQLSPEKGGGSMVGTTSPMGLNKKINESKKVIFSQNQVSSQEVDMQDYHRRSISHMGKISLGQNPNYERSVMTPMPEQQRTIQPKGVRNDSIDDDTKMRLSA
jgi:hypothetical protein